MTRRYDDDDSRLPIKLDSTSNGEFMPVPLGAVQRHANALAHEQATQLARRLGLPRRRFLVSLCGAASTLLAFNQAYAGRGEGGGYFDLAPEAALEPEVASVLTGDEFVFDVQGHFVNPRGDWLKRMPEGEIPFSDPLFFPKAACDDGRGAGPMGHLDCLGADEFVKDVYLDSDTDMMVLSFIPSRPEDEPLTIEEASAVADIVARLDGSERLLIHGRVNPNQPGDLEDMDRLAEQFGVAAWKTYTQWGPDGHGFWLTDPPGIELVERARALGVKVICIHKGIPFGSAEQHAYSLCDDIGPIARAYPDVQFIVYHAGWEMDTRERAYDPAADRAGIDSLIRSVIGAGLGPGSNVCADLGSTWRFLLRDPDQAAHALGKLLRYLGEDNVLWGTDSIWYGSPQDQIQAFRSFAISEAFQERHGYPELTPALKAKVLGLNAARVYGLDVDRLQDRFHGDPLARARGAARAQPDPHFRTYGPRTRREFLSLLAAGGGPGA